MTNSTRSVSRYRREIESLHEFFVQWYDATLEESDFDRLETALAPGFQMVTPDGIEHDRETVLEGIRDSYGRDAGSVGVFDIDIRNVEVLEELENHALVRYEEWQTTADGQTGRISTVLFREDASTPSTFRWLDVHETWLETAD